ncbi:uncharacterized protein LOC129092514 [Anoplopoma fimbria]|uniref:uncharacterized protein LOC129092514 n=1 Tax=Anoplopoma fimbria TaxID=229290 RepID=UPI0023ECA0E2|nr:uncharacterized protein LOC129092514 [Anoplopoma fimbria]
MGKSHSKRLTSGNLDFDKSNLEGCAKIMCKKHGSDTCKQLPLWVEKCGFPVNGSFSVRKIQNLEENLEIYDGVIMYGVHKVDWKAFGMWKSETETRQRRQEKGHKRKAVETNNGPSQRCSQPQKEPNLLPAPGAHQRGQNQQPVGPNQEVQGQLDAAKNTTPGPESALTPNRQSVLESTQSMVETRAESAITRSQTPSAIVVFVESKPRETEAEVTAWSPEDLRSFAKELPDIEIKGGAGFVEVLSQMVHVYELRLREIRILILHIIKLKWSKVQGDWPETDLPYDWTTGTRYRRHVERLCARIKTTFPATARLHVIQRCKQQPGEMVADYLFRLTKVFDENVDMMPPADPKPESVYEHLLKHYYLKGMDEQISSWVRENCIGFYSQSLSVIQAHAVHAEQKLIMSEKEKEQARALLEERLMKAQIRALQRANRGRGRGSRNAVAWNDGCWNCGDRDHWARDCYRQRKTRGTAGPSLYLTYIEDEA